MTDAIAFEWVCAELERLSTLDRLEARGTVRICLKHSGLAASSVTPEEMSVLVEVVLPDELRARGVDRARELCERLNAGLAALEVAGSGDRPEDIFRRLGGGDDEA